MPRVTKAALEEEIKFWVSETDRLRTQVHNLEEKNTLLVTKQFDVDAFCRMHANAIEAIAHVVTDLRILRK